MEHTALESASAHPEGLQPGIGLRNLWDWLQNWVSRLGRKPKIGLALGSGAALGVAHIGVLSVLRELKIAVAYLSGSSSGSFVGALYAGGIMGAALEACGREYRWRDAGRLTYFPKMGFATNDKMASYLEKRIGRPRFEDLQTPLYVTATNLTTGRLRYFHEGPVIPAIRASCAIPGIFAPVEIDGELYCDGGVLNRIPCRVLKEAGADLVIAVELDTLRIKKQPENIFEVINRALDLSRVFQIQSELKSADLVIRPDMNEMNEFGFDQNEILIERGKAAALDRLTQWPKLYRMAGGTQTKQPDGEIPPPL